MTVWINQKATSTLYNNFVDYIPQRYYWASQYGASNGTSSTNTQVITNDIVYAYYVNIPSTVSIDRLVIRTSSSNVSVGAKVKLAVYSVSPAGLPLVKLGETGEITITDAAVTTAFEGSLLSSLTLPQGNYFFALLGTATTTQARYSVYAGGSSAVIANGATSLANLGNNTPVYGYTCSSSYASGFPNTFGTPTAITALSSSSTNQSIVIGFRVL